MRENRFSENSSSGRKTNSRSFLLPWGRGADEQTVQREASPGRGVHLPEVALWVPLGETPLLSSPSPLGLQLFLSPPCLFSQKTPHRCHSHIFVVLPGLPFIVESDQVLWGHRKEWDRVAGATQGLPEANFVKVQHMASSWSPAHAHFLGATLTPPL